MKSNRLIIIALCCLAAGAISAQEVNYRALSAGQNNLFALHFGADYGTVYGFTYARRLPGERTKLLGLTFSVPFGNDAFDDWKATVHARGELLRLGNFSLDLKPGVTFRRYESAAARVYNFGWELQTGIGFYRPKWFAGVTGGYDGSVASLLRHRNLAENYPGIQDGWYRTTGGNFKFGVKTGLNFRKVGVALHAGKVYGRNFKDNPTLPFYLDLAVSYAPGK